MRRIEFDFRVEADHPSLPGHFPGHPVVPGVLLLDHVLHGLREETGRPMNHLKQVKFLAALHPGETAQGSLNVDGVKVSFRVSTQRQGGSVPIAEGAGTLAGGAPA